MKDLVSAAAGRSAAVAVPRVGGRGSLLLQASLTLASKSRKLRLAALGPPGPPDEPDWERLGRPGRAEIELFFQKVDPAP